MMLRKAEIWKGQYTFRDNKGKPYTNQVTTEKLTDTLFLEFGHRKDNNRPYNYVSLMRGNFNDPKKGKQLFFTHEVNKKWWVYPDDCLKILGTHDTKAKAVQQLREIAEGLKA